MSDDRMNAAVMIDETENAGNICSRKKVWATPSVIEPSISEKTAKLTVVSDAATAASEIGAS